jgi:beta-glucanase (GH16 family)
MVPITHYTNPVKSYVFNGTSLPADWSVHNGDDGYATTDYDASGVSFDGTNVCLTISKTANPEGLTYTSGMVETAGVTFSHGQFDCVIPQVPQEMGMWPAFWLIGATNIEIDGMESISPDYDTVHGTIHASDGGAEQGFSTSVDTSKPVTYSIVWEPGIITFAANGQAYGQATAAQWNNPTWHPGAWDFDSAALWLRLNLGMSYPGGWGSPPDSTTVLPAVMKVQSVKVYQ